MKRFLKRTRVVLLCIVIIALLLGLAVGTIWLFHKGKGSDWSIWVWISVLCEGICTIIITPIGIVRSIILAKDKLRKINEEELD